MKIGILNSHPLGVSIGIKREVRSIPRDNKIGIYLLSGFEPMGTNNTGNRRIFGWDHKVLKDSRSFIFTRHNIIDTNPFAA